MRCAATSWFCAGSMPEFLELIRCTEKFDKLDSGSSFLSRVQNFVEDLLTIWQKPEWISSEWFLDRILQCVMHVFIDKDGERKLRQAAIKNGCDAVSILFNCSLVELLFSISFGSADQCGPLH